MKAPLLSRNPAHRALGVVAALLLGGAPALADAPPASLLTIGRALPAPAIDGRLDDPCWRTAASTPFFGDLDTGQPASPDTQVVAAWDDDALYVAFRCDEPQADAIRAHVTDRDGPVTQDDAVGLVLRPAQAEGFYHLAVNARGTVMDEKNGGAWTPQVVAVAERSADPPGWCVELKIPWADLGGAPDLETPWTGNFYRVRRAKGSRISCWNFAAGNELDPSRLGTLAFADEAPLVRGVDLGRRFVGFNTGKLQAAVARPYAYFTARVTTPDKEEPLAHCALPAGVGEHAITFTYPFRPESVEWLTVAIEASGDLLARYSFPPGFDAPPFLAALPDRIEAVGDAAGAPEAVRPALLELAREGREHLEALAQDMARAEKDRRTLSRRVWRRHVAALRRVADRLGRPVVWTRPLLDVSLPEPDLAAADIECVLRLTAAQGERESAALLISNLASPRTLALQVALDDFEPLVSPALADGPAVFDPERIRLSQIARVRDGGATREALVPLNAAGQVTVPAGSTRELWVTLDARGAPSGAFRGNVVLTSLDGDAGAPDQRIPLRVRVLPIALAQRLPMDAFAWDDGSAAQSDACRDFLADSHVTSFHVTDVPAPDADGRADFSALDDTVARLRQHGRLVVEAAFLAKGWRPEYATWIRGLAGYLHARGIAYDAWLLHLGPAGDDFAETARAIKRVDPRVRVLLTHVPDLAALKAMAPTVACWSPSHDQLDQPQAEFMRAAGKTVWAAGGPFGPDTPPTTARALAWKAWSHGLDGVTCAAYPQMTGRGLYGVPLSSKVWEAWREGLEDYLLLAALDEVLAQQAHVPEDLAAIMDQARASVSDLEVDPGQLAAWRMQLAEGLLRLSGSVWGQRSGFEDWAFLRGGDGEGTLEISPQGYENTPAIHLVSATHLSWTFLTCDVQAEPGDTVRLSFWTASNYPVTAAVADGIGWREETAGRGGTTASGGGTGTWTQVAVEHVVTTGPVQVALGFGLNAPGAHAWISKPALEVVALGARAGEPVKETGQPVTGQQDPSAQ